MAQADLCGDRLARRVPSRTRRAGSTGLRRMTTRMRSSTISSGRSAPTSTAPDVRRRWCSGRPRAPRPMIRPCAPAAGIGDYRQLRRSSTPGNAADGVQRADAASSASSIETPSAAQAVLGADGSRGCRARWPRQSARGGRRLPSVLVPDRGGRRQARPASARPRAARTSRTVSVGVRNGVVQAPTTAVTSERSQLTRSCRGSSKTVSWLGCAFTALRAVRERWRASQRFLGDGLRRRAEPARAYCRSRCCLDAREPSRAGWADPAAALVDRAGRRSPTHAESMSVDNARTGLAQAPTNPAGRRDVAGERPDVRAAPARGALHDHLAAEPQRDVPVRAVVHAEEDEVAGLVAARRRIGANPARDIGGLLRGLPWWKKTVRGPLRGRRQPDVDARLRERPAGEHRAVAGRALRAPCSACPPPIRRGRSAVRGCR